MKTLKEQFVGQVVGEAVERVGEARPPRIMDLGCGTASYVPSLMEEFSGFEYVGIEPIAESYAAAKENLANVPNATVHFQLGYDEVSGVKPESFDVVFSLSVLEHIKQLERFIAFGAQYVRPGGLMVHRYDLGHALHPHSLKERLHVFLGNTMPGVLPERQFVRYVGVPEVQECYKKCDVIPTKTTYHQMPSHKAFEKYCKDTDTNAIEELFAWEQAHQAEIKTIPTSAREKLFPAIAVWGKKE